jgi:hypothetical protein
MHRREMIVSSFISQKMTARGSKSKRLVQVLSSVEGFSADFISGPMGLLGRIRFRTVAWFVAALHSSCRPPRL